MGCTGRITAAAFSANRSGACEPAGRRFHGKEHSCGTAGDPRAARRSGAERAVLPVSLYHGRNRHRREAELERFVRDAGYAARGITVVELPYDLQEFYTAVKGLENEPERGERCTVCYRMRLERAAQYARAHGFNWFTTTLSISPVKDPVRLNTIGCELAQQYGLNYLQSEFRKKDGYKRSLALSTEYGLYRQDYCGCIFSKQERGV